ncbi:penicillin-binding protein 2 [Candidatus Uhrbacteria bacterium CG_4_9_14_3_um_filter_36_7]|uniref:Penicillin-binding protein 2 n=1 Tax=Candidatus Uhrbacteria bacterium CG_4_9_14_3_um_filter_36_7 TaxID=1975033 RepID=A0A2M7XIJ7_9BACT|nr:MAG: penicillin-binding protein 2 [Candidatus Uhrbacteria bacterium CG_4_9_14_3_um_filter_36_7]
MKHLLFLPKKGIPLNEPVLTHEIGETSLLNQIEANKRPKRFFFLIFIVSAFFALFISRTIYFQIIAGETYHLQAENNRFKTIFIEPTRGIIIDRNGKPLAENAPLFTLTMTASELPLQALDQEHLFEEVVDLLHMQRTEFDLLRQSFFGDVSEPLIVAKDIPYETALFFYTQQDLYPGFSVEISSKRKYLSSSPSLSHILGYVNALSKEEYAQKKQEGYLPNDKIGKVGLEQSMETFLRGSLGQRQIEVDALGQEKMIIEEKEPISGSRIQLNLDSDLQAFIEQSLILTLQTQKKTKASVVALDPKNGDVLALVSLPTYDSNLFATGIESTTFKQLITDPDQPLFFRAISGMYPSGSLFKPFVATAALAEGLINEHTTFISVGGIQIGSWFFPDWKAGGHGLTNIFKAIAESVNTFFYIIGGGYNNIPGLGVERIISYAEIFGFGSKTGIDLPGEASGFLPSKEWKETTRQEPWYIGDTYHLAIGQGDFLTTPLQVAVAISAIANGGTKYHPRLIQSIDQTVVEPKGEILPSNIRSVLKTIQEAMRQTVTQGSARGLASLARPVAGKTGTAQWSQNENDYHAWFAGFGPYPDPSIVLVILIEEGGEGSEVAVPIASNIFSWWFEHKQE